MSGVLAELEGLQRKRVEHLDAVKKIDDELERVRLALGMPLPKVASRQPRNTASLKVGRTANDVYSYVPVDRAVTINELAPLCGRSVDATRQQCSALVHHGLLYQTRRSGSRPIHVARTPGALQRIQPSSEEGDGELGQSDHAPIEAACDPVSTENRTPIFQAASTVTSGLGSSVTLSMSSGSMSSSDDSIR